MGGKMNVILFACIEKNIGDDLFVETICHRYPEIEFYITEDAQYGSLKRLNNLHFSKALKKWIRYAGVSSLSPLKNLAADNICKVISLLFPKIDGSVYIVGNAFKNMKYEGPWQILWLKRRASISNNFFILSTNFGPYNNSKWVEDTKKVFSKCTDVCFRDENSYRLFSDLSNIRYSPDAIFSLGKKKTINNGDVLFSVIDGKMPEREHLYSDCAIQKYESLFAELIDYYVRDNTNVKIILSNSSQDRKAADRIIGMCSSNSVEIVEYDGNLEKIKNLFENSSIIYSTRLHTTILGVLYGLKVIPFIYDEKVENVLNSIKFDEQKYHISQIDASVKASEIVEKVTNYHFELDDCVVVNAQKQFSAFDTFVYSQGEKNYQ